MSYHRRKLKKVPYSTYLILFTVLGYSTCSAKSFSNDTIKSKVEIVENVLGYSLEYVAAKLKDELNAITNEELGVTYIQKMYKNFKYTSVIHDIDKNLKKITDKLELKLNETFIILNKTREVIEKYYYKEHKSRELHSFVTPCNDLNSDLEEFDVMSDIDLGNAYIEQSLNIKDVFKKQSTYLKNVKSAIKQQYFLSTFDVTNESVTAISKCNRQDHSLFWKTYMSQLSAGPRNVMLLLDHGGSLSKQQFQTVKSIAKHMISVLRKKDRIGLLALSDDWSSPYLTDQCLMPNQAPPVGDSYIISPATKHNKSLLKHFIDSLSKGIGATNHSLGFQQALQTIRLSNVSHSETVMLLYISRGLLSSLTEPKTVLETVAHYLKDIVNPIIINTCAVIDETKPVMYEMHFLKDIAHQNYTKYNIVPFENTLKGIMLPVNSTQNVGLAVSRFYNTIDLEDRHYNLKPKLYLPTWDDVSKDITLIATVPCGVKGEIGMLGVDLYFSNIAEDIIYYSNYQQYTYGFIIDNQGVSVMHPSYPRPAVVSEQPLYVDIIYLEQVPHFEIVRNLLLTQQSGSFKVKNKNQTINYVWRKVLSWYTVCLVKIEENVMPFRPYKVSWYPSSGADLVHYRLDLLPSTRLCRHLNQIATLDAGSLYLSALCFQSPFAHIYSSKLSALTVQSYMAYLKDNTRLLANPGLREEVRDDVAALARILKYLRDQHLQGSKAKYIVRRYVTSPSGVLQLFPGALISPGLEPTKRNWYLRAIEHKYKTILTPPYLDAGGAGYIVTLAHSTPHVVSAMDVTFGFVYRLMLEHMPFCSDPNIKCFMMDDRGYLIYHPNLIDPNGHGPIEQQHIIHKESLVANDILNHKDFVKKMLCNNYADGTVQRYYSLNTSLDLILDNTVHGEDCVRYQVGAVKGTNIFIGVVNASCEVVATFCPCSMVDRLCLNCNRMEQRECECPCECPLNLDTCTHPNQTNINNPLCSINPEQSFSILSENDVNIAGELDTCLPISCEAQRTHGNCLGILGCEWCKIDVDGESLLANPFCTSIQNCFNGVLGSPTPYGDSIVSSSSSEDLLGNAYSPVGPVIGSVFGVCLGLVLLFFCYRSYTSPSIDRFYLTSAQENRVRMSDLNISDDYRELDNHQDKLLQDTKKPEPVSPYCVSSGYRRPPTTVDSDHGYSTMTPHDESEHLSFAPLELDSLEDECISDATSVNTSVSSKQPQGRTPRGKVLPQPNDLQITSLPSRNCIIAPVTVHRNMETTQ